MESLVKSVVTKGNEERDSRCLEAGLYWYEPTETGDGISGQA